MFCCLVFIFLIITTTTAIPTGSWTKSKFTSPPLDKVHYMCLPDGILITGGRNPELNPVRGAYLLNVTTATWSAFPQSGSSTPVFAAYHAAVGTDLYMFGGNLDQFEYSADMVLFSYDTSAFKTLSSSDSRPTSRTRGVAVNIPGTQSILFAFGYTNNDIVNEMNIYDTVLRTWKRIAPDVSSPPPRFEPCCKPTDTEWYCFGGYSAESALNDVWVMNFTTFKWRQIVTTNNAEAPTPRRAAQCAVGKLKSNNHVFIVSGGNAEKTTYVYSLDLTTHVWKRVLQNIVNVRGAGAMCSFDSLGFAVMAAGTTEEDNINAVKVPYDTLQSEELVPIITVLDRRSFAAGAIAGSSIYTFFGIDYKTIWGDGWVFTLDLTDKRNGGSWSMVFPNADGVKPRYGAAAVTYGRMILIFGGLTGPESIASENTEVVQFNTVSNKCELLKPQNDIPGRAYHAAAVNGRVVVVYGGSVGSDSQSNEMKVFDVADLRWYDVSVSVSLPPRLAGQMISITSPEPHLEEYLYLIGGMGLGDRWKIQINVNKVAGEATYSATATSLPSVVPGLGDGNGDPDYLRGEAAIAGDDTWFLLCGGSRSTSFPVSNEDSCIIWNSVTGSNNRTDPMPFMTYGSVAIYFGRTIYVVAGASASGGLKRPQITYSDVQIYTFHTLCESKNSSSVGATTSDCVYCSVGTNYDATLNDCTPVPAGSYAVESYEAHQCPPGTYSDLVGAASARMCVSCPEGSYASSPGSTKCLLCPPGKECKFGASFPTDPSGDKPDKVPIVTFIDAGGVPYDVWIALAVWSFAGMLILAILPWMKSHHDAHVLSHYLTDESKVMLDSVYEAFSSSMGMNEIGFLNAIHDPRMKCITLSSEQALRVFRDHDSDGSSYVDNEEFAIAVVALIDLGYIQPFPDSKRAVTGRKLSAPFLTFLMEIDAFVTDHKIGSKGDPVRLQMTVYGGYISILKYIGLVVVIVALTCIFVYDNTVENLSTLPLSSVGHITFSGDTTIVVTAHGPQNVASYCDVNKVAWNSTNIKSTSITVSTQALGESCRITWLCKECILSMTQDSTVMIELTDDSVYADSADFQFIFATGVAVRTSALGSSRDMTYMQDSASLPEPPEGSVYKGSPASGISVSITPVKVKTFKSAFDQAEIAFTGYQGTVTGEVAPGNTVNNVRFGQVTNVPFRITFQPGDALMLVNQVPRQSVIDLITGILASLSGLTGGLLALLNMMESKSSPTPTDVPDISGKEVEEKYLSPRRGGPPNVMMVVDGPGETTATAMTTYNEIMAQQDMELLHGVLRENVPAGAAIEMLDLIREVVRQAMPNATFNTPYSHNHNNTHNDQTNPTSFHPLPSGNNNALPPDMKDVDDGTLSYGKADLFGDSCFETLTPKSL